MNTDFFSFAERRGFRKAVMNVGAFCGWCEVKAIQEHRLDR
jgi:hypothetical protein